MAKERIKFLFSDLGGVLLTNGWDHKSRKKAVEKFGLDEKEFESRHQLLFGDYETGKIDLKTYLEYVVFYQRRNFSFEQFTEFMYAQSQAYPDMLDYIKNLKQEHHLKVVAVSNEGRELTNYRIKKFALADYVDFFIVSCFIGTRKPDTYVWKLALDLVQAAPHEVLYLEDRKLFVEITDKMGIHAIWHQDLTSTAKAVDQIFQDTGTGHTRL